MLFVENLAMMHQELEISLKMVFVILQYFDITTIGFKYQRVLNKQSFHEGQRRQK